MNTYGFEEAIQDSIVLVNNAAGIQSTYTESADLLKERSIRHAEAQGLHVTGAGISGIQYIVDSFGFRLGWITRPFLHLYFHEIGTYKDPPRPHVRPASDESEEEIYNKIQNKLTEGV